MDERMRFVIRLEDGETMASLCQKTLCFQRVLEPPAGLEPATC
jgi:hypothetical protein